MQRHSNLMNRSTVRRGTLAAVGLAAAWACLAAGAASAEDRYAQRSDVVVRAGKGPIHKPVATLGRGDRVSVVGRDEKDRKWLKVEAGGKTGWVYEDALSTVRIDPKTGKPLGGDPRATAALAARGSGDFSGSFDFSLAGSGWDAARYQASKTDLDRKGLDKVLNSTRSVSAEMLESFQAEGNVGPAAQ